MFWGTVILIGLVWFFVSAANDKKKNPEKWAAFEAEREAKKKRAAEKEYKEAMQRVPPSEWMRMSRHEKADVLERREKAVKNKSEYS
jgi:hypothetical protein